MALSDLAVYSEYAYKAKTEVLNQQIQLFNDATEGAIVLVPGANRGDFDSAAHFARIAGGVVRRRNAYADGVIAEKALRQVEDISVKVAAGTPPIRIDPGQYRWIQMDPKAAGAAVGIQMAVEDLADMLNTGLGVTNAALATVAEVNFDATAAAAAADKLPTWGNMLSGAALMGDSASGIVAWLMHSATLYKLYANNLTNGQSLFTYGSVNVQRDPFGKLLVMTDSPALVTAGTPNVYTTLGLRRGALTIEQNNDFEANEETKNGQENIVRTYQAEWSYNVSVDGFAWDKANGGKSPSDAALMTGTNWDRFATSHKDLAGVRVKTL